MSLYKKILRPSFIKSSQTTLWLMKIILPVSLFVGLLDFYGGLAYLAQFFNPFFVHLGLPGSTAIVFITSIFLPLYAPLAIIMSMTITLRELTILALMCQIAHNLPVESAIQAKTGSSFWGMTILRIVSSIVVGVILNLVLPQEMGMPTFAKTGVDAMLSINDVFLSWITSSFQMAVILFVIISALNILYKVLLEYNLIDKLTKTINPVLRFFGLSESVGFLWLIGYIVGLAYGGAMMIEQLKDGRVTKSDVRLLNYHLAISHSILEDNIIFVALGVSYGLILLVRLTFVWIVVWTVRLIKNILGSKPITI